MYKMGRPVNKHIEPGNGDMELLSATGEENKKKVYLPFSFLLTKIHYKVYSR